MDNEITYYDDQDVVKAVIMVRDYCGHFSKCDGCMFSYQDAEGLRYCQIGDSRIPNLWHFDWDKNVKEVRNG